MIDVKDDIDLKDFLDFHPNLWVLFAFTIIYCSMFGLPFLITSLRNDRGPELKRPPHWDSPIRAFDFSLLGWTEQHIERYKFLMNMIFRIYGAYPMSQKGKENPAHLVCLDHGASKAYHMHVQCKRELNRFLKFEI